MCRTRRALSQSPTLSRLSQAYLWLATPDPFVAAAAVFQHIDMAMDDDNHEFDVDWCVSLRRRGEIVQDDYMTLHRNVDIFSKTLVELCWSVRELTLFRDIAIVHFW